MEKYGAEINIELKRIDKEHYILRHSDNGPGIPEDFVMQVYCSMFAGSKFRNIQSRGQQGLGCSGCVLLSQMTTGEPARVISCYQEGDDLKGVKMKFKMDVKKNKGMLMEREDFPAEHTGVCIELQFKDVSYSMAEQGAFEYIRRTMIGNPHAKITFRDPTGHKYKELQILFQYFQKKFYHIQKELVQMISYLWPNILIKEDTKVC